MKKVMICLPSGDDVKTDFAISLFGLTVPQGVAVSFINARTSIIEQSRYVLVKQALQHQIDYVFFMDSDLWFPPDAFARLLAHDRQIVGATYPRRREPHTILGFTTDNKDLDPEATGLVKMNRIPLGFVLISAGVFDLIAKPWFEVKYNAEHDFWISEDYYFCDQAIGAGLNVWCDLDLSRQLQHVGGESWTWGNV